MVKDRFFLSYSAEEAWLNKMASEGYHLTKKSFYRYTFEVNKDINCAYSVEVLYSPAGRPQNKAYLELKESKAEYLVASYKCRAYFKKPLKQVPSAKDSNTEKADLSPRTKEESKKNTSNEQKKMAIENMANAFRCSAAKTRVSGTKSYILAFSLLFLTSLGLLCYHCASAIRFIAMGSSETMSTLVGKVPPLVIFEKIAKLLKFDVLLGDSQATLVAFIMLLICLCSVVPLAVYISEYVHLKKVIRRKY